MLKQSTLRMPQGVHTTELIRTIMEDIRSHFHHTKYEYKKEFIKFSKDCDYIDKLNEFGQEGWMVVNYKTFDLDWYIILMREVVDENQNV